MDVRHTLLALALLAPAVALGPSAALAQQQAPGTPAQEENDCRFLERSFQEVYDGLRAAGQRTQAGHPPGGAQGQSGSSMARLATQNPELVAMFVGIQRNIIMMHQARGCAASDLIAIARQEAEAYSSN
ncbi:hypothetical protein [Arenibaculum sp.]|jgi:hypothetical protein|uniref:hypothetical protein n=1 Tax=Arenibaculum sp. TaxID=2865862 RepID=UPI002E12C884|nr:hypothetical protein [Arenibaculum sp.]